MRVPSRPSSDSSGPASVQMVKLLLLRRDLDQQALAQIARAHSGRVKMLHQVDGPRRTRSSAAASSAAWPFRAASAAGICCAKSRGQLFFARRQVAILVQIADHKLRRLVQLLGSRSELPTATPGDRTKS
jgi:hypothetical protein